MSYLSLIVFTIATCGTPGPNNIMIMSSGMTYGLRRSWPHVAGINVGFPLMVLAVGLGMGELLERWPIIYDLLRPVGAAYLLYLAYRIMTGPVTFDQAISGKPLSFTQSALFQVVNPKAWVMVVGALSTYATTTDSYLLQVVLISLIFLVFGTPCTVAWLLAGLLLKRVIVKPLHFRAFNVIMATLLVLTLIPIVGEIVEKVDI